MNLSTLGALFVFSVLLTRTLGPESLGLYALFTAFLMPFTFFVDLGQSTSLVQEIGRAPARAAAVLRQALGLKLVLALVAGAVLLAASYAFFSAPETRRLFWLFGLILLPRAFYATFEAGLRARQLMLYPMLVGIATALLLVGGSAWILGRGHGFAALVAFLVALETGKALLIWLPCRTRLGFRFALQKSPLPSLRDYRRMVRGTLPFFAVGLVGLLHYRLDVLLLGWLRGPAEVGVFSAAAGFVKVLRLAPSVLVAAFFPAIASLSAEAPALRRLTWRTLAVQLAVALALSTTVFLLAEWLIIHTYRLPEAVAVLRVLVWSLLPLAVYATLIYVFYRLQRPGCSLGMLAGALVLNLSLNALLIPGLGARALAYSTLASETFSFVVAFGLFLFWLKKVRRRTASPAPAPVATAHFDWEATT